MSGPIDQERIDAHGRLLAAIAVQLEASERIACLSDPARWQSEDKAEQEAAMFGCHSCAALEVCRRYVSAHPEPAGVWAGLNPHQQKRLHRKEQK